MLFFLLLFEKKEEIKWQICNYLLFIERGDLIWLLNMFTITSVCYYGCMLDEVPNRPYSEYGEKYGASDGWESGRPANDGCKLGGNTDGLLYGWYRLPERGLNGGVGYVRWRSGCVGGKPAVAGFSIDSGIEAVCVRRCCNRSSELENRFPQ